MEIQRKINDNSGSFYIEQEGKQIAELDFRIKNNSLDAYHTGVRPELEGQGIAGKLFNELVDYARENGYTIIPTCAYVQAKLNKNPDLFRDVRVDSNENPSDR